MDQMDIGRYSTSVREKQSMVSGRAADADGAWEVHEQTTSPNDYLLFN